MAILRVQTGNEPGKTFAIQADSLVLGRDSGCEVQVLHHPRSDVKVVSLKQALTLVVLQVFLSCEPLLSTWARVARIVESVAVLLRPFLCVR